MKKFNWRAATAAVLIAAASAGYALAQNTSNSGQSNSNSNSKSDSSQNSANNTANQDQNQATNSNNNSNTNNANNTQSKDSKSSADNSNSRDQAKPDQQNQNSADRSNNNSDRSSNRSQERDARDSARSDNYNDRSTDRDRDRSSRDNDRNSDNRSSSSNKDSSRDRSSRRDNMRGPDIGIWFSRSGNGLVIADVSSRGAIAKLGFREGDRIVSVNDRRVTREDEFINFLLHGDARRVKVIILRDNREETIYVEPAVLIDENEYVEVDPLERFGIIVDDRYDDRIVVWRVIPRSPAYYAGFRPGDVVVNFNGRPYRTRTEFERGSREWKAGNVNVQIRRGERTRDLSVEIPNADQSDRRNERTERRDDRTAQRDSNTTDQGNTTDRSDQKTNNNQGNTNRGGILNGIGRGRGNR